jgi:hypothetical protein
MSYSAFEAMPADTDKIKRAGYLQKSLDNGVTALALIKTERSDERDEARNLLLNRLCRVALELNKLDKARELATELILEFGQSLSSPSFDNSTHVGNVTLGIVSLRAGDVAKAKEHLLIAIRAPLRQNTNYLENIDTRLAKELFEKGEKDIVIEYFKLCEGLSHLKVHPDLYESEIKALKLWQDEIKRGKTPSFDFEKAEAASQ